MTAIVSGYTLEEHTNEFVCFDKEAIDICAEICKFASINKGLAIKLKTNWEKNGIIDVDAQFEEVQRNSKLMKTFLKNVAQGLPDTIDKSNFGLSILSDFQMYHNGGTDARLNALVAPLNLLNATVVNLQKKRTALFTFVRKIRNDVLDNMELVGTPDRTSHKAKPKPIKTKEDVAKEISKNENEMAQAKSKASKKQRLDDGTLPCERNGGDDDEDDEVVDEEVDEEVEEMDDVTALTDVSPSNGEKTKKRKNQFIEAIARAYPSINSTGIYIFMHSDGELYCAPEELNEKFSADFFATKPF